MILKTGWEIKDGVLARRGFPEGDFPLHGFTTRKVGDFTKEEEAATFARAIGAKKLLLLTQVHGIEILPPLPQNHLKEADAWEGEPEKGVFMGIKTADCMPVLLFDPCSRRVAAVHAGWRSAVDGIIPEAVGKMTAGGARAGEIIALLGPALGGCCFEVGGDVFEAGVRHPEFFRPTQGGKFLFDLEGFCLKELSGAGVLSQNAFASGLCTRCNPDYFYSFRRGDSGRLCSFIGFAHEN